MKPRVVIAVADRAAWAKHRAALPNSFEVFLVESASEAMTRFERHGPIAALATELRVPGDSGLDLLADVRAQWPDTGRILVEGVQMIKRHTRPNPAKQIKGGNAEKERSIHASNVMVLTAGGVPTRIGYKVEKEGGVTRRTPVARKTGEALK